MTDDKTATLEEMTEAWNDWVDPREYLTEDPTFTSGGSPWIPVTSIDDRADGRFLPYYDTEEDLARMRGQARNVAALDAVSIGASDVLTHYTLGGGLEYEVVGDDETIRHAVQRCVDSFVEVNDLCCGLDRELQKRSREDGEAMLRLMWMDNILHAVTIEPDQLVEPSDPRDVEEWMGIGEEFVSSWTFGVHADTRLPHVPLNYYVIHEGTGADFDVVPASEFIHVQKNVYRTAKRGVSDYFPIIADLKNGAKLKTNLAIGSALQAAIAWVENYPPGTLQADVNALDARLRDTKITKTNDSGTRTTTSVHRIDPGTIVRPSPGRTYGEAPLGTERSGAFIEVAGFLMRTIGVRWTIPEYMISGDASNSNFASTLVAESPFVKAREADQGFETKEHERMLWKAARMHFDAGHMDKIGADWNTIRAKVDINAKAPSVASRDPLVMAQRQQIEVGMGTLSRRTAATEAGRNYDEERDNGAAVAEPIAPVAPALESWVNYP